MWLLYVCSLVVQGQVVKVELWFGSRLGLASLRTILSHVNNMMVGVTKGYLFKMKYVYAHFPINLVVSDNNKVVEVKNYLVSEIDTHNQCSDAAHTVGMYDRVCSSTFPRRRLLRTSWRLNECSGSRMRLHFSHWSGFFIAAFTAARFVVRGLRP